MVTSNIFNKKGDKMKVTNRKSLFALLLVNSLMFAAMPQNMSIVILNNSRKPMNIATGEYGTGKNAENLKLNAGGKSKSLVFSGEKYKIYAAIETGNHYEIKYNPDTVKIEIINLQTRQKTEIPATTNLKYVATLD